MLLAGTAFAAFAAAAASVVPAPAAPASTFETCAPLLINATAPTHTTSPFFASYTIDPSRNRLFFNTNFSDPRLLYLARELGGSALIRFGGGGADTLTYGGFGGLPPCDAPQPSGYECLNKTTLDALAAFAAHAGSQLIFGLNIVPAAPPPGPPSGPLNTTQARGLLLYARAAFPAALFGLELGNERNHHGFTAPQQSAAFDALHALLQELWPAPQRPPALVGPDADGAGNGPPEEMIAYLAQFVQLQGARLRGVTHHEYLQVNATTVLNATFLDRTGAIARQVVAGVRAVSARAPVWGGEVGPHTGDSAGDGLAGTCGGNLLCGRFGSAIWYADAMAAKASSGYDAFFRQDFVGASYALVNTSVPGRPGTFFGGATPSPDYYLLYLWARLVGARVLAVGAPGAPATTRAYGFCTRGAAPPAAASATLVLLNIDPLAPACLQLPAWVPPGAQLTFYTLTPGAPAEGVQSWGARLNGALLELAPGGLLPSLAGRTAPAAGGAVELPPLSVSLVVVPAGAALGACA